MKEIEAEIKNTADPEKIRELLVKKEVYDKRQNALKISANSAYGILGAAVGLLPFMPGAMCTTFKGRMAVQTAANSIQKDWGGQLIYGDTDCVRANTPVLIRYLNQIDYKKVEDISDGMWKPISANKEISQAKDGYEIWSDQGFTKIVNVVRCVAKPMSRIVTHNGVVECSNEHSLLREDLSSATPLEIKIGDKLCTALLPLSVKIPFLEKKSTISLELARVWGLFYKCGVCTEGEWSIWHENFDLLYKCAEILEKNMKATFEVNGYQLLPKGLCSDLKREYRELFYSEGIKRIPAIILNSPLKIRQAFFEGYSNGDNVCFTSTDSIDSARMFFLLRSLGRDVFVGMMDNIYILTTGKGLNMNAVRHITPIQPEENEYIYDMQTENHHFSAGVGEIVVHNSNYVSFPQLKTAKECWDYSTMVAKKVSELFPKPMSLAFEEKIYWRFFIITKKRYMSLACKQNGILDTEISKKGVLLQRRDNCNFVRKVYGDVVMMAFNREKQEDILNYVIDEINKLCSRFYSLDDFIITKSVGDYGDFDDLKVIDAINDKNKPCKKVGDYTVKALPLGKKQREEMLRKKDCDTENEYYLQCMPAQVQLAEKMFRRGQLVVPGSRIEYVITDAGGLSAKQSIKIESAEYFQKHSSVLTLDYLYYLKLLTNPLDQVLNILYDGKDEGDYKFPKNFVLQQFNYRSKVRSKVINELKNLFRPELKFER